MLELSFKSMSFKKTNLNHLILYILGLLDLHTKKSDHHIKKSDYHMKKKINLYDKNK